MPDSWQEKFDSLKKATEDRPNDGLAWIEFGDFLYHESENPNLALRAYKRAQELLPHKDMRLKLGRAYVLHGEAEKGFAMLRASASERPRAEAYCILSDAYCRNGLEAEAEAAAREAIRLEPSFEEGHYLLGEAIKSRNQAAAIDAYRIAISLDSNYALAWQALGRELVNGGNAEDGVSALKNAVRLDSDDVWSRIFLANGLWKIGQLSEAEEQYLAAISLAPEFPDLQRWYQEFQNHRNALKKT